MLQARKPLNMFSIECQSMQEEKLNEVSDVPIDSVALTAKFPSGLTTPENVAINQRCFIRVDEQTHDFTALVMSRLKGTILGAEALNRKWDSTYKEGLGRTSEYFLPSITTHNQSIHLPQSTDHRR